MLSGLGRQGGDRRWDRWILMDEAGGGEEGRVGHGGDQGNSHQC